MDAILKGVDQVGDGLPGDWKTDAHEGTCGQDQDVLDFVKDQALSYFEHHLMRRLEAEDSDVPDNEFIELALRDVGVEYIPKRAIRVHKYYTRQPRGLIMDLNTSVQQYVER
jgi:hypothetical protein